MNTILCQRLAQALLIGLLRCRGLVFAEQVHFGHEILLLVVVKGLVDRVDHLLRHQQLQICR